MAHSVEPAVVEAFMALFRTWLDRKPYEASTIAGAVSNIRIAISHMGVAPAGDRVDQYIPTLSSHLRSRFRWAWDHYVTFCTETRTTKIPGRPSPPRRGRPPNMGNGSDPNTMPTAAATLAILILLQRFRKDLMLRLTWGDYFPEGVSVMVADDGPVFWYTPNRNQRHIRAVVQLTSSDVENLTILRDWAQPPSPYAPLLPERPGSTVPMSMSYLSEVVTHFRNHRMEPQGKESHVEPKPQARTGRAPKQQAEPTQVQRRMGPSLADMAPVISPTIGRPGMDDLPAEVRDLLGGAQVEAQKKHREELLRTPGGVDSLIQELGVVQPERSVDLGQVEPAAIVLPPMPKSPPPPETAGVSGSLSLRERRLRALQRRGRALQAPIVEELHDQVEEEVRVEEIISVEEDP